MGINGLFSFLKKYSEKQRVADAVKGKKIAVDIFWFIHKSKGDIEKIKDMLDDYVQGCSCVLFIFDGKVSDERKPELSALKVKRQEMQSLIENLEKEVIHLGENADSKKKELMKYIEELRLQSWAPKGNYVDTVKELIEKWWGLERCSVIVAPYEADLYFGDLS